MQIPWDKLLPPWFIALAFSIWGIFLRIKELNQHELWVDEKNQLQNLIGPFKPVWQRLSLGELTCFPGEYLLNYPFVALAPANKWIIAIPHMVVMVLGFYLLYKICRQYLKTSLGLFITFGVFALNGNLIFHALEFRPYAVLPTLALANLFFASRLIRAYATLTRWKIVLIWFLFLTTIIYHAYGILIVSLCLIYAVITESRKGAGTWRNALHDVFPFLALLGAVGMPVFAWFASGTIVNANVCQDLKINTFDAYPNPLTDPVHFFRQLFSNLLGNKKYGQKLLGIGVWIAFLIPQPQRLKLIGFFLLMIVMPIELILVSDLRGGYWFLDRQFVWVMPFYAFFLGWCWETIYNFLMQKSARIQQAA